MLRTHLKIPDSTAHSPAIMLSSSPLLLGPILANLQTPRTSICSNIQANQLPRCNSKQCSPSSRRRWVEEGLRYRAIRNHQVSRAFWISNRCSQTWCTHFSKLQVAIITVWACTMEDRTSLVQATTLWPTCIQIQGLCWSHEKISILKIYIARWYSRCKGSNNYYERSKVNQMPMIG